MNPLETLCFRFDWRVYQARILKELDGHMDDGHLHVVAAPGSGKTVLGLEVLRRLGEPAIICAPTITIRNQWISRITDLFLPEDAPEPDWISTDVHAPAFLTVITYQALHAAFSGEEQEEENPEPEEENGEKTRPLTEEKKENKGKPDAARVLKKIRQKKVRTLVLDEAHHLRRAWWKALTRLKEGLDAPSLVSLTATPPFDVGYGEWQRYEELCGPADAEISVPELVRQGDLCPHQDYVYFSLPTDKEAEKLRAFKESVYAFTARLLEDEAFLGALSGHPWLADPTAHAETILAGPAFFSSILVFLNHAGKKIPGKALKLLGVRPPDIPPLSASWLETLYTGVFFTHEEDFAAFQDHLTPLRRELSRMGAVERRKVVLENTRQIKKTLAASLGKLDSIREITRMEAACLGPDLRQVILTDFIRKSELPKSEDEIQPISRIGVVPVFEFLRRAEIPDVKLGILTGSLVILPVEAKDMFLDAMYQAGMNPERARFTPLGHDPDFVRLVLPGEKKQQMVRLVTEVFSSGGITVLAGTAALLGEGWDAPSANCLVLASHVGSYMLSNQMRGRAIRTNPKVRQKTANIWHLAAVDPAPLGDRIKSRLQEKTLSPQTDPLDNVREGLGHDLDTLRRRFRAFEGPSFTEPVAIENGFRRLGLGDARFDKNGVDALDQAMLDRAADRQALPGIWKSALEGKRTGQGMARKMESNAAPRGLAFVDTIRHLIINALVLGGFGLVHALNVLGRGEVSSIAFRLALILALAITLPGLFKALYLLIRNGSLENSLGQVGRAIVDTLRGMDAIETPRKKLRVTSSKDNQGVAFCSLEGGTAAEKKIFLDALEEVLSPVDNPRYLLVRKSHLGRWLRVDFHAVPAIMGKKRETAEDFAFFWKKRVGKAGLVYTRNEEGRQVLLRARTRALSSAFRKKADRVSVWE